MRVGPVVFGEVLFDVFPDGTRVLGGAPFNVAWHLAALGLDPLMITRVGDDADGDAVLARMQAWGMRTDGVQRDPLRPTGQVEVQLVRGEPCYTIREDVAWDAVTADAFPDTLETPLVYHGTLATRSEASHAALEQLLRRLQAPAFVDVNLRDPWWDRAKVLHALEGADTVKLNEDELVRLTGASDPDALLDTPGVHTLVLTRGERGACWMNGRGTFDVQPEEPASADGDPVGAGDAFAAVCIAGRVRDWPVEQTLASAQTLASRIVGLRGATPEDRTVYDGIGA